MLRIALTGGMGTGKSYVSLLFESLSFPVFHADEEAKKLYVREDVEKQVRCRFGDALYESGQLDRRELARIIFDDPGQLSWINHVIHPLLIREFEQWLLALRTPVAMLESAIVFEADLARSFDLIVTVHASLGKRLQRLQRRNPEWSETEILQRIRAQMDQQHKIERSDLVVWNEEDHSGKLQFFPASSFRRGMFSQSENKGKI